MQSIFFLNLTSVPITIICSLLEFLIISQWPHSLVFLSIHLIQLLCSTVTLTLLSLVPKAFHSGSPLISLLSLPQSPLLASLTCLIFTCSWFSSFVLGFLFILYQILSLSVYLSYIMSATTYTFRDEAHSLFLAETSPLNS